MNSFFYPKLALYNIKKNAKLYFPYLLANVGIIIMFYNMCFLAVVKDIGNLSDSGSLRYILFLGSVVIGIFSVIFLFYTNSFLIKRRKKEFGLYNILGMEKKHIAKIMVFETFFITLCSLGGGILLGILLSKLMILLLFKIISFKVTFGFEIPAVAIYWSLALFGGISILNLFYNVLQVYLSKPIDLIKGGSVGEKEPKTKWILASIGAVCLGIGYYIALTTESPLAALNLFFIAVVLVIIGTYCLFIAGSIALLKMLRKNKRYYYKPNNFISVSGMIYRMKQNAAGLASICILSTAVIVMLSTTLSMYVGMEDILRTRYPRNIIVDGTNVSDKEAVKLDSLIEEETAKFNVTQKDIIRYRPLSFSTIQNNNNFSVEDEADISIENLALITFITLDDYNKMENQSKSLLNNEALLYTIGGNIPDDVLSFNGFELAIKEQLTDLKSEGRMSAVLGNSYYVVVNDIDTIRQVYTALNGSREVMEELSYYYGFDVDADKDVQINLVTNLRKGIYGGLFFLGIFLGLLFIMATVLIIYYKQIAEGYDDKERFEIMQKVGMSHGEVKQAIHSQVLTVFFLPLVTAIIHIAFAFKVITKLLSVFNLTNIPLFALCTAIIILLFAVLYAVVYAVTAKTYYKIVSW